MSELDTYDELARRILATGILSDPWIDGRPRFGTQPIVLSPEEARALAKTATDVGALYDELCTLVAAAPELLETFFALTPFQRALWLGSQPSWHGIARVDAFFTATGIAVTEINCDTPTGEAEAVVLGQLCGASHADLADPNGELEKRFLSMVDAFAERMLDGATAEARRTVGLVYPTELTDDLSLVRLYKRWLEGRGYRVVLGSPYNLDHEEGQTRLFDVPIGVLVRHYKTDWWGERASAWKDDELRDSEPLVEPLRAVIAGLAEGSLVVVNPFGSVLPQNKRSMAFFWEHRELFSPAARATIDRHVPVTQRLETMDQERLQAEQAAWVLKSDYGAEGDEVVVGKLVSPETWRTSLSMARPGRWIAQRFFDAVLDESGAAVNFGVFLVAGRAAGLYARVQVGATDGAALSTPVLVRPRP